MNEALIIPKHWQMKRLGEVCQTTSGGTPSRKKSSLYEGNIPWVKSGELDKGLILDTEEKISEEAIKNSSAKIFPKGTLLIALYGATIGKLAFLGINAATNQAVCGIFKNNEINLNFLYYFLFYKRPNLIKQSIGGAQPNISQGILKELNIPLPPLPEQQAIVSKIEELLSDLDNGVQQLQTAQQQLKVYRQSLLKAAFEGKLTYKWRIQQNELFSSEQLLNKIRKERSVFCSKMNTKLNIIQPITNEELEKLPELPVGMAWVKLGEITWSIKDGPHYSPKYQETGIAFISGGNIRPQGIDFKNVKYISKELHEELSRRCKPEKGDVLYTKGGTTGIARVNDYDIDFNVWVHVAVLKVIPSINPFYLQHVLNSDHCYKQSQKLTHGVGNQDLGLTRMIHITLPLCSVEEQNLIVSLLESKLTLCDKIEETIQQSLQQTESLRQSILKKAFEGRLVDYSQFQTDDLSLAAEQHNVYSNNEPSDLSRAAEQRNSNGHTISPKSHPKTKTFL